MRGCERSVHARAELVAEPEAPLLVPDPGALQLIVRLRAGHPVRGALHAALRLAAARWLAERDVATQTSLPEPTPLLALTDLVASRLTVDEQRDLVARLSPGVSLRSDLPDGPITPRSFAMKLVELLDAKGLIDDELFAVLCQMIPAGAQEILALALRFPQAAE